MTTMTRFVPLHTPFEDVISLQKRLNSIFNEFCRSGGWRRLHNCELCPGGGCI